MKAVTSRVKHLLFATMLCFVTFCITGCFGYADRVAEEKEHKKNEAIFMAAKSEYTKHNCEEFKRRMYAPLFNSKNDIPNALTCLPLIKKVNDARQDAYGSLYMDELQFRRGYEDYITIFTALQNNQISVDNAKEVLKYVNEKSHQIAEAEINRSNTFFQQIQAKTQAEQQEQQIRRNQFDQQLQRMRQMTQNNQRTGPSNTNCHPDGFGGIFCNSMGGQGTSNTNCHPDGFGGISCNSVGGQGTSNTNCHPDGFGGVSCTTQ